MEEMKKSVGHQAYDRCMETKGGPNWGDLPDAVKDVIDRLADAQGTNLRVLESNINARFNDLAGHMSRSMQRVGVEAQAAADVAQNERYRQHLAATFFSIRLRSACDRSLMFPIDTSIARSAVQDADALIAALARGLLPEESNTEKTND